MWISRLLVLSLVTGISVLAQVPRDAGLQMPAQDAFRHLPPMPSQVRQNPTPVRMPLARPKPVVVHAQVFPSRQCAIPLLNVTPKNKTDYSIQTIAPPKDPAAARSYVNTVPVCDIPGQSPKADFPVK